MSSWAPRVVASAPRSATLGLRAGRLRVADACRAPSSRRPRSSRVSPRSAACGARRPAATGSASPDAPAVRVSATPRPADPRVDHHAAQHLRPRAARDVRAALPPREPPAHPHAHRARSARSSCSSPASRWTRAVGARDRAQPARARLPDAVARSKRDATETR